mgnify:FL=1
MRLDKFIGHTTSLSRAEAKKSIKKGVLVNGRIVKTPDFKIDEFKDEVIVNEEKLIYQKYIYIMMNKPKDIISATEDNKTKTVVDILDEQERIFKPFPVGRLDKDTEGLMLLTNDGDLAHKLTSPKKDIVKKYYVEVFGTIEDMHITYFKKGVILDDGYKCKSAILDILTSNETGSKAYIYITEGKFHQVKRMMKSIGCEVTYLKRLSIGELVLDENLKLGEYRYLTEQELKKLKN